jgi:hypothetical protein
VTRRTQSKRQSKTTGGVLPRVAPWAALGVAVVVLGLLALAGQGSLSELLRTQFGQASGSLDLTIIHTNDTYGYVLPCG